MQLHTPARLCEQSLGPPHISFRSAHCCQDMPKTPCLQDQRRATAALLVCEAQAGLLLALQCQESPLSSQAPRMAPEAVVARLSTCQVLLAAGKC